MRILKFRVESQKISKDPSCDFKNIVKGTQNYLYAKFYLGDGWRGCKVAASFWCLGKEYPVVLSGNGICAIPEKALIWNKFGVSLTGMKDGGKYIIKTNIVEVDQE